MTKLIKPVMIDNIIRSGVVLKSKKAYKEISKLELTNLCAIRAHDNRSSCAYYKPCADISMCKLCFLNANNYLNVLKYIKHMESSRSRKSGMCWSAMIWENLSWLAKRFAQRS